MSISRVGNGTTQACAACKYQRRKCAPDCILAPYFPHDRQRQFLNAHKLFGVSNITKIIKNLDPPEKDAAMNTIIFQSDVRAIDPVGGCYRIVRELQRQIEYNKAELELVLHQLAICRAQAHQQAQLQLQETNNSTLACDLVNAAAAADPYTQMQNHYFQVQPEQEYIIQNNQQQQQLQDDVNAWVLQDSLLQVRQQQQPFISECDDVKPGVDKPRDRHEIKFEPDEFVQERRFVPSTQLVISS